MTAPVRDLGVKFSAQGSETVKAAIAQVSAAAQQATERAARAAADAVRLMARRQEEQAASYQMTLRNAEQAAYAEQALRTRTAEQARRTAQQSATVQQAAAAQTARTVSDRYGMMALSVAASFNQMSFIGKTTSEGLRNIVVQSATTATMIFGKGGPWGAAIAVGLLSLNNLFNRARKEQEKFEEEWMASLTRMVNAGDAAGLMQKGFDLQTGTAAKNYQDGITGLNAQLEKLGSMFDLQRRLKEQDALARAGVDGAEAAANALRAQIAEVRTLWSELGKLTEKYADVAKAISDVDNAVRTPPRTAPITVTPAWQTPGRTLPAPGASATSLGWQGERYRGLVEGRGATALPAGMQMNPADYADSAAAAAKAAAGISMKTREEIVEEFRKNQSALSTGIADTLAGGIAAGIAAAVTSGDIGTAIRSLAGTVLAGLGDVFAQIAVKAIMQAELMATFMTWLTANPFAALAAATAMMVLARSMGGSAEGGGGRGGMGGASFGALAGVGRPSESSTRIVFGQNSVANAAGMTPRQALNVTIIGPDDARAQRAITELLAKAEGRGLRTSS